MIGDSRRKCPGKIGEVEQLKVEKSKEEGPCPVIRVPERGENRWLPKNIDRDPSLRDARSGLASFRMLVLPPVGGGYPPAMTDECENKGFVKQCNA